MRLKILCRLLDGEVSVAGLESELGLKQPSLSQQLGHLREADIVTTRREAKSVFYSLADDRVRAVVDALRDATSRTQKRGEFGPPSPSWLGLSGPPVMARAGGGGADKPSHDNGRDGTPSSPAGKRQPVECGVFAVVGRPIGG